jgi:GAF domain-containing protein
MAPSVVLHEQSGKLMTSTNRSDIADSLAHIAREINTPRDLDSTLQAIVDSAQHSLPGIDHVGITLAHRHGEMETRAATGDLVWDLDKIQYELREGPCVHAIKAATVVKIEHADREQRWPDFIPRAVEKGLRSQLGIALYNDEKTLGGLNMYSTTSDTIDPDVEHMAELFAGHAALALGHAVRESHLHSAMASRQVIGQAVGIIMERYSLNEGRAFDYLARVSSHGNIKVREVAQEVVDQADKDH